jgi:hypothetical protein
VWFELIGVPAGHGWGARDKEAALPGFDIAPGQQDTGEATKADQERS